MRGFYDIPPLARVRDYSRDGLRAQPGGKAWNGSGSTGWTSCSSTDPDDFIEQAADEAYPALAEPPLPRARSAPVGVGNELARPRWPGSSSAATWTAYWWPAGTR